jgi:hypothetical protein
MPAITPEIGGTWVVSDANEVDRVILGDLGNGDFGLKVIGPDGTTEIIDGVSDVFRIVGTGTLNCTAGAGAGNTTVVAHPEFGSFPVAPAVLQFVSSDVAVTSAFPGPYISLTDAYVSLTSGGPVTTKVMALNAFGRIGVSVPAGVINVTLTVTNYTAASLTLYARYYLLFQDGA